MFFYYATFFLFMILSFLLCIVIMMQESKTSGLGGAFGGEVNESLFGVSTAEVLKKFTAWLVALFFFFCVLLSFWTSSLGRSSQDMPNIKQTLVDELEES